MTNKAGVAMDAAVPGAAARRVGVPQGMDRALARVRSPQGEVVGSGFLVDSHHVVTCTHVVLRAAGRADHDTVGMGDSVAVDFPLAAPDVLLRAEVEVSHPLEDEGGGDITVLSLTGELPPGLDPPRLIVADDVWGHPFRAFGFPHRLDQGVWAAGVLRAPQGAGWVQMEGGASGYAVEAGFSGGAVWDDELAGVVGMTVAADARPDLRTAFLIPSTTLMRAWPRLAERSLLPCPYRGLYPFRSSDTALFFGREDVTDRLVREALRRPLLAVVGPSGSGKSSVVFAGVVPRLGREPGWMSVSMRPAQASSPLFALAAALIPVLEPELGETERLSAANALATVLRDGQLSDVVDRVLARAQLDHLLLVVDQMEELFAREQDEVQTFTRALLSAAALQGQHPRSRSLTILLTLRVDFLSNALQDPGLAEALEDSVFTIGQMRQEQLRTVIEGPLPSGIRYEAGLVERILNDVGDPGSLPLLEFALTLLWERQEEGRLTHRAYHELGGVDGALASYAERVYSEQLLPKDQNDARRLFTQLVLPSESGTPVRRAARRPELSEPRWQLGQRLAATRLLVADRDSAGAESVELVHEALIAGWSRLQEWVREDSAFRAWQERLRIAMAAWGNMQHDPGALLRGAPLAEAEKWLEDRADDVGEPELQFISASRAAQDRSVRRLRQFVAGLAALLLITISVGGYALRQQQNAWGLQKVATLHSIMAATDAALGTDPRRAIQLGLTAHQIHPGPSTEALLLQALTASDYSGTLLGHRGSVQDAAFSPDGRTLATVGSDASMLLWDVVDRDSPRMLSVPILAHNDIIHAVAFSRDGRTLATSSRDRTLRLWDYSDRHHPRPVGQPVTSRRGEILAVDFSPSGDILATASDDGTVLLWDLSDPANIRAFDAPLAGHSSSVLSVAFSPDGRTLATASHDASVLLWDVTSPGQPVALDVRLTGHTKPVYTVSFSPNGNLLATGGLDMTALLWDISDPRQPRRLGQPLAKHTDYLKSLAFSPDGRTLATAGDDRIAVLWDVSDPERPHLTGRPLVGHAGGVTAVTFSADSRTVATASRDTTTILWDVTGRDRPRTIGSPMTFPSVTWSLAFTPDSQTMVTTSGGQVLLWDVSNRARPRLLGPPVTGHKANIHAIDVSADGATLATASADWTIILWDISNRSHPRAIGEPLKAHGNWVNTVALFPDGKHMATGGADRRVMIWDISDRAYPQIIGTPLTEHADSVQDIAVFPGGRLMATAGFDKTFILWDVSFPHDARPVGGPRHAHAESIFSMAASPDGLTLATASLDKTAMLWDVSNPTAPRAASRALSDAPRPLKRIAFSPDGRTIVTGGDSGDIFLYDVSDRGDARILGSPLSGHVDSLYALQFSPDGRTIATGGSDGRVVLWDVAVLSDLRRDSIRQACLRVGGSLTQEVWDTFAPGYQYEDPCNV